jgi:hypothetical protein
MNKEFYALHRSPWLSVTIEHSITRTAKETVQGELYSSHTISS